MGTYCDSFLSVRSQLKIIEHNHDHHNQVQLRSPISSQSDHQINERAGSDLTSTYNFIMIKVTVAAFLTYNVFCLVSMRRIIERKYLNRPKKFGFCALT
jgi:hypothetical protein